MVYEKETKNGWNLYTAHGEVSFAKIEALDKLSNDIKKDLKNNEFKFIFNFQDVPFIDSSGIAVVILAMSSAMKNKTPIKVCGLNEETRKSFEMIRMNFGIRYYDNIDEALKSIE